MAGKLLLTAGQASSATRKLGKPAVPASADGCLAQRHDMSCHDMSPSEFWNVAPFSGDTDPLPQVGLQIDPRPRGDKRNHGTLRIDQRVVGRGAAA